MRSFFKCPRLDSNQHAVSSATTSRWCVYQFRHPGIGWDCKCKRLFSQYNSESGSFSRLRMFYKQLPIMVLFNNSLAKR